MTIMQIKNLTISFKIEDEFYAAVDGVSIDIRSNEVFAIVGESGSGKSALALSITNLLHKSDAKIEGRIIFNGRDLLTLSDKELNAVRGKDISIIFQDPHNAFNPLIAIGRQIEEGLFYHTNLDKKARRQRVLEFLKLVGLDEATYHRLPHELSGGMLQRAMIALALICDPAILIADEPTTALDVSLQAAILDLLRKIQRDRGLSIILITHDFGVVAEMAHRVAVMYAGQIVEIGSVHDILKTPRHPYTRSLLRAMPNADTTRLYTINGVVPSLKDLPKKGCRFAPRMPHIFGGAHEENPIYHKISDGHYVLCSCYKNFDFGEN